MVQARITHHVFGVAEINDAKVSAGTRPGLVNVIGGDGAYAFYDADPSQFTFTDENGNALTLEQAMGDKDLIIQGLLAENAKLRDDRDADRRHAAQLEADCLAFQEFFFSLFPE